MLQNWTGVCGPLANKARLFGTLKRALECGAGESRHWPETWVLRNLEAVKVWGASASDTEILSSEAQYFVKHPQTSGGTGTIPVDDFKMACACATMMLKATDAVVMQRAVNSAALLRGPSAFELRVWALLRQRECWLFQYHRAKTATSGLMNRQVQMSMDAFGKFYADNVASEIDISAAIERYSYDVRTKPDIATTVTLLHQAVQDELPTAFVFIGFDFIVDTNAKPWLIEANVKPAIRFADPDGQFPSPIVRELARYAIEDLVRAFDGVDERIAHAPSWARCPLARS